ncbi:MAG: MFS transporter [Dysgonamonadaceae bacterium]|jgi:predicted MFS family arabinose efflux permease|nr:MFS transporter [Dysgonamonadaceae bacterium]
MNEQSQINAENSPLTRGLLWLMTIGSGLVIANLYYNQPLLSLIANDLGESETATSRIAMLTQLGYAAGLLFIVPLGDMFRRKRIILTDFGFILLSLLAVALSPSLAMITAASFFLGLSSVIPQIFIPLTAQLSKPGEAPKNIATVVTGLLTGMLLSRVFSGILAEYIGWRAVYLTAMVVLFCFGIILVVRLPEIQPAFRGTYKQLMGSILHYVRILPDLRMAALRGALTFGSFSMLWSTLAFQLNSPPFNAGSDVAGAMGLIGVLGAVAANITGRLINRYGQNILLTVGACVLLFSWVIFGVAGSTYAGLITGIILLDMGQQTMNVSNQSLIFKTHPEATNRINTAYMVTFFIGGAAGTFVGGVAWGMYGWKGVAVSGIIIILVCLFAHLIYVSMKKKKRNR